MDKAVYVGRALNENGLLGMEEVSILSEHADVSTNIAEPFDCVRVCVVKGDPDCYPDSSLEVFKILVWKCLVWIPAPCYGHAQGFVLVAASHEFGSEGADRV